MNYIVFDLEWNQGRLGRRDRHHAEIPFEIIEIGAVKLNEQRQITDSFQSLIRPKVYKDMPQMIERMLHVDMKELKKGDPFESVCERFLSWCGEDPVFCTWGNQDLVELQRNMRYFGLAPLEQAPFAFLDIQKLFSIAFEDGKQRRNLEYAIDHLELPKDVAFHRAAADAYYTAKVFERIDPEYEQYCSYDVFTLPASKEEEIHKIFPRYSKYISRPFPTKHGAMQDKEVTSTRCYICDRPTRRCIKWFTPGGRYFLAVSRCPVHGYLKSKVRLRKHVLTASESEAVYVDKTQRFITQTEMETLKAKRDKALAAQHKRPTAMILALLLSAMLITNTVMGTGSVMAFAQLAAPETQEQTTEQTAQQTTEQTQENTTQQESQQTTEDPGKKQPGDNAQSEDAQSEEEPEESVANKTLSEILHDTPEEGEDEGEGGLTEEQQAEITRSLTEAVETNSIARWPQGPAVSAEGAILIEAETGTVLYGKNMHKRFYPASTTKILTTLLAIENCDLNETVSFSKEAVNSIERSSSNMGIDIGQQLTMEQCLYGILVYSANEVANAVAEHVDGSIDAFVERMNRRASELGCLDSHFVTTNGLHDDNHYTTPYDLSQIGRAFFANETLAKISGTNYYHIPPAAKQPDDIELYTHNQMTKGKYAYNGYVGGKTGYTTVARQTLVTCAERGGLRLICVVMKDEAPNQYLDTMALFDYGFENFQKINVAENETRYTIKDPEFFENDALAANRSLMEIDPKSSIIMPNTLSFEELDSFMNAASDPEDSSLIATIRYSYENNPLGEASVLLSNTTGAFDFYDPTGSGRTHKQQIYFLDVKKAITILATAFLSLLLLTILIAHIRSIQFSGKSGPVRQNVNFRTKPARDNRFSSNRRRRTTTYDSVIKSRKQAPPAAKRSSRSKGAPRKRT